MSGLSAPATLAEWLAHIERVHPREMALGLERVAAVRRALGLKPAFPLITVGGTNGKGSCCALLEAVLQAAGYRTGCYTSPHLLRYNERVRIAGAEVPDEVLCASFARVEAARGDTQLTYFEYGTLAALLAFAEAGVEVAVLEVGLGGRLDAVNAFDADAALVASVDLDHMQYLGDTREAVGYEKAGIFRKGRPAVCADRDPPASLQAHAAAVGANLQLIGRDFDYETTAGGWRYRGAQGISAELPRPRLPGAHQLANAAGCRATLEALGAHLPVTSEAWTAGLNTARPPARFERRPRAPGRPEVVLDVAHNPHAARALAAALDELPPAPATRAVFSMLADKDAAGVAAALGARVTHWHVASSAGPRGAPAAQLAHALAQAGITAPVSCHDDVSAAWHAACSGADENDRILVCGSFLTVAAVMQAQAAGADRK